jgi:nucleoid DNA-binding protein
MLDLQGKTARFRPASPTDGVAEFFYERKTYMAKTMTRSATKSRTKSEVFGELSGNTGLPKRDVAAVFDNLANLIKKDLKKGPGVFTVPGLMKIKVVRKKATKARRGVNPFTGEEMMFKAKPASKTVKVAALKGLKDMV